MFLSITGELNPFDIEDLFMSKVVYMNPRSNDITKVIQQLDVVGAVRLHQYTSAFVRFDCLTCVYLCIYLDLCFGF